MSNTNSLWRKFESFLNRLHPLSVIYFGAATACLPANQMEAYADLEFIIANACSIKSSVRKRECTGDDFEKLLDLSRRIREAQNPDYVKHPKGPRDWVRANFYVSRSVMRGKAYPPQMLEAAFDRFHAHDEWFSTNLGFTIDDCISLALFSYERYVSVIAPVLQRIDDHFVARTTRGFPSLRIPKQSLMYIVMGAVTFTKEMLLNSLKIPEDRLEKVLSRLSKELGLFSKLRNHVDFCHLYETPIIRYGKSYLVPLFPTLCQAISETFYYDVSDRDPDYLPQFEAKKGIVSENRVNRYFANAIPSDFLFPNVKFRDKDDEHEIADLIVLFDDVVLIVQNKSKILTLAAQKGDTDAMKKDLDCSIIAAYEQCVKAKYYLLNGKVDNLTNYKWKGIPLIPSRIRKFYYMITLEDRYFFRFLKDLDPWIDFEKDGHPFIVNLYDLEIITSELSTPLEFIDYVEKRTDLNSRGITSTHWEIDLLGYYLMNGRDLSLPPAASKEQLSLAIVDGYWDEFMKEKLTSEGRINEVAKSSAFIDLMIQRAHEGGNPTTFELITHLSRLSREQRAVVGGKALEKSMEAASDNKMHCIAIKPENAHFGITFLFTPELRKERQEKLFQLSAVAQYISKCKLWIGIASEPAGSKAISYDYLLLEKEWEYEPELEKLKGIFKSSELIF